MKATQAHMPKQAAHPVSAKERPILFSAPMVRAILAGRKTQTRRIVKPQPHSPMNALVPGDWWPHKGTSWNLAHPAKHVQAHIVSLCPYGAPGDRLWVKETWGLHAYHDYTDWHAGSVKGWSEEDVRMLGTLAFRADVDPEGAFWRPSIFMRRWMSRISLPITSIRVERLQDISEEDAKAEGVWLPDIKPTCPCETDVEEPGPHLRTCAWRNEFIDPTGLPYRDEFALLWASINGADSWTANPWVWVVGWDKAEVR